MKFALREHTADVAVEAEAPTIDEVFAAVADGLAAAMCDDIPPTGGERFSVTVRAESKEALLFDYLDQLIYERDVRGVLPVDNQATVHQAGDEQEGEPNEEWEVEASARGIPLHEVDARDVKAVTYSDMELAETDDGWRAYVVLDV